MDCVIRALLIQSLPVALLAPPLRGYKRISAMRFSLYQSFIHYNPAKFNLPKNVCLSKIDFAKLQNNPVNFNLPKSVCFFVPLRTAKRAGVVYCKDTMLCGFTLGSIYNVVIIPRNNINVKIDLDQTCFTKLDIDLVLCTCFKFKSILQENLC